MNMRLNCSQMPHSFHELKLEAFILIHCLTEDAPAAQIVSYATTKDPVFHLDKYFSLLLCRKNRSWVVRLSLRSGKLKS